MEQRRVSRNSWNLPETLTTVPMTHNGYDKSYEYYMPQGSPAPEHVPQRSPVSENHQSPQRCSQFSGPSPRVSAGSPPPTEMRIIPLQSPLDGAMMDDMETYSKHYSEYQSPHPERVYDSEQAYVTPRSSPSDKEYYTQAGAYANVHPTTTQPAARDSNKRPIYKRRVCLVLVLITAVVVVITVVCGVVFGRKSSHISTPVFTTSVDTGDPYLSVGGNLNANYYSKKGAWNGSGIALAAANPGKDETIFVFYQTYQGDLTYKLVRPDRTISSSLGIINDRSYKPLNGTPLSIVARQPAQNNVVYHLFYIDEKYYLRERILRAAAGTASEGSVVPIWTNGPLNDINLKTLESPSIGLQACFWNNFRGGWNTNYVNATDGIHLWFPTSETEFAQYSWTNGTSSWIHDTVWVDMDGHAGVACQTWATNTVEYVWFVDKDQAISMYWRDQNYNLTTTPSHPISIWTKVVNIDIPNIHRASSLGYTVYMLYQDQNGVIRGANTIWAAENTTLATSSDLSVDDFAIRDYSTDNPVKAIRGTHMAITALKTPSGGSEVQVYFQQSGSDITYYTRDRDRVHGTWQVAGNVVPD